MAPHSHHLDQRAAHLAADGDGDGYDLFSTRQLAAWLGISTQWLEIGRSKNYGPPFLRLAPRMVRYRRADVLAWLATRTHACTAEYQQ